MARRPTLTEGTRVRVATGALTDPKFWNKSGVVEKIIPTSTVSKNACYKVIVELKDAKVPQYLKRHEIRTPRVWTAQTDL